MYLLLCGKQATGKDSVAAALRDYYTYRGTACYIYDYMQPIHEAHDAVYIALQRYGFTRPPDSLYHRVAMQSMYDWLHNLLFSFMEKNIAPIVKRWNDLKMFHVTLLHGMTKKEHLAAFPSAYKVLLTCEPEERTKRIGSSPPNSFCLRDYNHPIETGFNDCAVGDIFDLVVDTTNVSPDKVASHIAETLHRKLFGEDGFSSNQSS